MRLGTGHRDSASDDAMLSVSRIMQDPWARGRTLSPISTQMPVLGDSGIRANTPELDGFCG
jgi:hypothetical protein